MNTERRTQNAERRTQNAERRITFCTLFNISNEHLTKDLGLIPYGMHKYEDCDSFMATYINGDYSNLKYTSGLRIEEIDKRTGRFSLDSCFWLKNNAKRIDVLNLYHTHKGTLRQALVYKFFNPHGKIYLKLDGWPLEYIKKLLNYPVTITTNSLKLWWHNKIYRWLFRQCNFVSTEFASSAEVLSRDFHQKIGCVPNPFNPSEIHNFRPFSERSNTIIYVGRVERAKGSDILLEAFAKISQDLPNWSLKLVGNITQQEIVDDFRKNHLNVKERVIFTGQIHDRQEISELYRDAKIFAFPSRYESFGIALTEAMVQGCFAVTSNIPPNKLLTENFRFALGSNVDDIDGLAQNFLYACTHEQEIESLAREGRDATLTRCDLKRCCDVIAQELHI